jgi:hypothetical protein
MTNSNRFLNRLFVFIVGLVLLVAGGAVAAGALLPGVQKTVADAAASVSGPTRDALSGGAAWILWVTALVAVVLIVILIAFVLGHGHGRTSTLLRVSEGSGSGATSGGSLVIDSKVAQQVFEEALSHDSNIAAVDVAAFSVKGETVLRITVHSRRGASPVDIRRSVDESVRTWDSMLGASTPVFVQIVSGIRSQMSSSSARVA